MRVAIVAVLIIAGLGLLGVAFAETSSLRTPADKLTVAPFEVRAYAGGGALIAAKPANPAPTDSKPPEARPPEAKPAEPVEAKPAIRANDAKAADPKPSAAAKTDPKPAEPKAAEPKPAEAKPAAVAGAPRPAPAAAGEKKPAGEAAPAAAAGNSDALLNLRATDTADVYIDGRKVGPSPVLGFKVKPGKHKVRFDCYEASGATAKGPEIVLEVRAMEEKDNEFECTAEAKVPSHDEAPY